MTTIGFDLDMTLIDSRPGIRAAMQHLADETGATIDTELVVSRLGPPLEHELAHWFPEGEVARTADRYREIYAAIAPPLIEVLPGAHAALEAVAKRGRSIVITAKYGPNARLHVDRLGLPADAVFGDVWRDGKATVLREQGALAYVGDHVHDMDAARLADVVGVGVVTGPCSADELHDAEASVVLASLEDFPEWLATQAM
ncbi:HAD family hydrolase [Aeromicrobium sp.]|uniref:HAD family hydrolase n=1 Tax=Aeromicrobium sp. TaxID=1871063 RepID=UPI002FCBF9C2